MPIICPRCGGTEINCPVCHLPPKRTRPKEPALAALLTIAFPSIFRAPAMTYDVNGVDISSWNGVMDLAITKTKAQYAFIRAGYGEIYQDYRSDTYRQHAILNDFPYGLYWYCYPGYSAYKHAESFAQVASLYPYQLELVLDVETTSLDKSNTLLWLIEVDQELCYLTGKNPIIYTSRGFWDSNVARSNYFASRMNWVANWTTNPNPYMPSDFPEWGHWQHSADGNGLAKEYGMVKDGDPDIDLDYCCYTVPQFNDRYNWHLNEPEPPALPDYFIVNTGTLNIRSEPNPYSSVYIIGETKYNKKWKPIGRVKGVDGRDWWRINEYAYCATWLTRLP